MRFRTSRALAAAAVAAVTRRAPVALKLPRTFVGAVLMGGSLLGGLAYAIDTVAPAGPASEFPLWGSDPAMRLLMIEAAQPDLLQVGPANHAYWIEDGVWGAKGMTRGTFTSMSGTTYETAYGASKAAGANGEIGWRSAWKFPDTPAPCGSESDCYQEIKTYPSAVFGAKPGWGNPANMPGGFKVRLWPGSEYSYAQTTTPGSFLPMAANGRLPAIHSSFSYRHLVPPEGKGQLTYDIWLQNTAKQCHGFNNCKEITHEIMIPLANWGGYGACGTRNEGWKVKDGKGAHKIVAIDGRDWCLYKTPHMGGTWDPARQAKTGGWTMVVFQPMKPLPPDTVHRLNLSSFINYVTTQTDAAEGRWAAGTEHLVSVELGTEVQLGVGDIQITNFRVWKP